jgi:NDP-sugar pyrophosphorylase family protein
MPFKIPDEEVVSLAIRSVMNRTSQIETQKEFLRLVRKELSKIDGEYRVSGERIRKIGIENGIVKITIEYRESDIKDLPHICPVCRNAMTSVMNRSLEGEYVEIKRKCTVCSYAVGKNVLVPGRYIFSRAKGKEVSPQESSVRKLKMAGAKVRQAIDLVSAATAGTEYQERGEELISRLKGTIDSGDSGIKSISSDIKSDVDSAAKKNSDRKDI